MYGKNPRTGSSSSSSLIFDLPSSPSLGRSSSPPSSPLPPTPPLNQKILSDEGDDDEEEEPLFSGPLAFESEGAGPLATYGDKTAEIVSKTTNIVAMEKGKQDRIQSSLKGFFAPLPRPKKPLEPSTTIPLASTNHPALSIPSSSKSHYKHNIHVLDAAKHIYTQSHLTHLPLLFTCQECQMSYVRSSPSDESTHRKHHDRVVRGIIWDGLGKGKGKAHFINKGEAAEGGGEGWKVVREGVRFGRRNEGVGRVIVCDGSWGGSKVRLSHSPLPT
jgi:N-acetyltransferase